MNGFSGFSLQQGTASGHDKPAGTGFVHPPSGIDRIAALFSTTTIRVNLTDRSTEVLPDLSPMVPVNPPMRKMYHDADSIQFAMLL